MIRRPPRSTLDRSSAASDVYKRQLSTLTAAQVNAEVDAALVAAGLTAEVAARIDVAAVSYTHLRAHETVLDLVCRLLLEQKKNHRLHRLPGTRKTRVD